MRIVQTISTIQIWRLQQKNRKVGIGLIPTMGALHNGHRLLIQRARKRCKIVVVSIFVNPIQFSPSEDFHCYPRKLRADLAICLEEGVDIVFIPKLKALYPSGFQTTVTVHALTKRWEGEYRPTHFHGVTTIVTKLFNLIRPSHVFFGQKDYQQFLVLKQLVKDLDFNVKLNLCRTIREKDGLALSSRNQYLTPAQRKKSIILYQALTAGKFLIKKGQLSNKVICNRMRKVAKSMPHVEVDYMTLCNAQTLEPIRKAKGNIILLGAIRIGTIRLIDNILIRIL